MNIQTAIKQLTGFLRPHLKLSGENKTQYGFHLQSNDSHKDATKTGE
jgi:hypothetical protein